MVFLQILSALLLLLNKIFVRRKKTIGWVFGIWGTVAITIYFYLQMKLGLQENLWIMVVYDISLIFLMIYGYIVSSSHTSEKRKQLIKKWNVHFKITVVSITIIVCAYFLYSAITAQLVFIQFLSAVGGLAGTLLLAFNRPSTNMIGWVFYFITHSIVTYLMFETGSPAIALCQIFSAWVALLGFIDEVRETKTAH